MRNEEEIRAFRDGINRYRGCCSVPQKNAEISAIREVLAWILEEKPDED